MENENSNEYKVEINKEEQDYNNTIKQDNNNKQTTEMAKKDINKIESQQFKFCYKCGAKIFLEAEICPKCGCRQPKLENNNSSKTNNASSKFLVVLLLCIFVGMLGGHRFYVKKTGSAIIILILTITAVGAIITGIWWFIDLINIVCENFTDSDGNKITM